MATSFHKVNNNAASTLNAAIDDNDLSLAVPTGEGAEFDTVAQYLTLGRSDTYNGEILDVASRSSDTFTVTTRGVDGTTATAHDAGDRVECLLVAAHITEIQDAINAIENGTTTLAKIVVDGNAASTMKLSDAGTNTVVSVLELYHMSSGTPAAGLGAKLLLGAENSNGDATAAMDLQGYLSVVTDGAEYGEALLKVMYNGAQKTVAKFTGKSDGSAVFYDTPLVLDTTVAGTGACWFIMGPAGTNRHWGRLFSGNNATTGKRWDFYANSDAESGGNAGTNLRLAAYDDSGVFIDDVLIVPRAQYGEIVLGYGGRNIRVGDDTLARNMAVTIDAAATYTRLFQCHTGSVARWSWGANGTAESGSNAGSDFAINALSDAGSAIDTPITIARVAGGSITITRPILGAADTDTSYVFGRARFDSRGTDIAYFSHYDQSSTTQYGLRQNASGATIVNSTAPGTLSNAGSNSVQWSNGRVTGGPALGVLNVRFSGMYNNNITSVGNVGSGEDDLMTLSVAAAQLPTNKDFLRFKATFTFAANANSKRVRGYFGATAIYDSGAQNQNGGSLTVIGTITRVGATSQLAEIVAIPSSGSLYAVTSTITTPAETLSGAITFKFTGEGVSDNDIVQNSFPNEWLPAM
jgi:hypothetical protein